MACAGAGAAAAASAQDPTPASGEGASQTATPQKNVAPVPQSTPQDANNAIPSTAPGASPTSHPPTPLVTNPLPALQTSVWSEEGKHIASIEFAGVTFDPKDPLLKDLKQAADSTLNSDDLRADMRRLFASGRYRDLSLHAVEASDGLHLIWDGLPRYFVGRITVAGVPQERLASLLEFATKLEAGTPFTESEIPAAEQSVRDSLAQNGYYQPEVHITTQVDDRYRQVHVLVAVKEGPQARIGQVTVDGPDAGLTPTEFKKYGSMNCGRLVLKFEHDCTPKVDRETASDALSGVQKHYVKIDHLEGTITLESEIYQPPSRTLDYDFNAEQGPTVKVVIDGVKIGKARTRLLIPVYEEGAVDNDLLNEGLFNLKDFEQQKGYFDVKDSVKLLGAGTRNVTVQYDVVPGDRHRVRSVTLKGNHYFNTSTLQERFKVKAADKYIRNGVYSAQLVQADASSMEALYKASGFEKVKVTSSVTDVERDQTGRKLKEAAIDVTYTVDEGPQQKFGSIEIAGENPMQQPIMRSMLTAETGQPFSLINLANDRDSLLSYLVSNGYDHAKVEVTQTVDAQDPTRTNVLLTATEGEQVRIDHVLVSGLQHVRPSLVQEQLRVKDGDPLNQSAILQTQRNLYNLALFNEVNAAVQNPQGQSEEKNVLVQLTEARRWDVTYGFGFEVQLNTPALEPGATQRGSTAAQNGKAGASPRVSLDVSRINFRGTQQSLTLHTQYGLLEQVASLSFNNPFLLGNPNLTATASVGYSNVQNITTFEAKTSQADLRVTQKVKKADTFIWDFQYRRVNVDADSLEISPNLIPQLSEPVRVGGPGVTYFHDTRDPSPLDAQRGQYFSVSEFVSDSIFGSDTNFNRLDTSFSTYYTFGSAAHPYTFARNTRVAFENTFGSSSNGTADTLGISNCAGTLETTNATCNPIPLAERLYAGGATSHRGFGINDAGPRDLTTGYPVGGSAAVVNTFELRLPPPTLPVVGNSVGFVLFHDMGNVFRYPGDMFTSIKNFRQPNRDTCRMIPPTGTPVGILEDLTGTCNFNYYSHAVGLGARYKTPVGPIRLDFSYNLNPPIYPVEYDYTANSPYVGQASHFQFFFSIGQAF